MYYSLPGSSVHGSFPNKSTGVGCHCLLQGIFPTQGSNRGLLHHRQMLYHLSHQGIPKMKVNVSQSCPTLCDPRDYSPWTSLGRNTGVGSRSLLQGIFPTQGSNPCLLHCRWILYQLSHKRSPGSAEAPVKWNFSNPAKNPTKRYKRHEAGTEISVFKVSWRMQEPQIGKLLEGAFTLLSICRILYWPWSSRASRSPCRPETFPKTQTEWFY